MEEELQLLVNELFSFWEIGAILYYRNKTYWAHSLSKKYSRAIIQTFQVLILAEFKKKINIIHAEELLSMCLIL